ncbi:MULTISPECIES: O-antigen ligase family protein [Flavobacterium]|uniref:O-antigen ligase family protein n=1 Tax=Flavobacterium TaxID=237 RepID=UPI001FCAB20A|nr:MULTISPECIES: O-antigen ligase family protein [Flavobacterium]UOK43167.1 O-antigen ligase family protein [Flavobacterium enshiense]
MAVFKGSLAADVTTISRISIVILAGLVFLNSNSTKLIKSYIFTINLAILVSFVKILLLLKEGNLDLANGEDIYEVLPFDRPYLGFFILLASLFTFHKIKNRQMLKPLGVALIVLNVFFVVYIAARLALISYVLIGGLYVLKYSKISFTKKVCGIVVLILILFSSVYFIDNIKRRFKFNEGIETFVDYEPRFVIWPCSSEIITKDFKSITIGSGGFDETISALTECYSTSITKEDKRDWYVKIRYNSHNQFLGILLVGGIIGLSFFVAFVYFLFKRADNFIFFSIVLALTIFFIFECVLYRQLGCYIVGLILSLVKKNNES